MPNTALGYEIPSVPWSKVATDIFHFKSQSYLLVVNYTSRFPIVREIKSMSAQHSRTLQIDILRVWLARYPSK